MRGRTVTAADDADAVNRGDADAHGADGGYDGVEASSVVVTVSDNDRGVTVSETSDGGYTTGSSYTWFWAVERQAM